MVNDSIIPTAETVVLKGTPASRGYAAGPAFIFKNHFVESDKRLISDSEIKLELDKLDLAIARSEKEIDKISAITSEKLGEEFSELFDAQIMMLKDVEMLHQIRSLIRDENRTADYSVDVVFSKNVETIRRLDDPLLSQRAQDIEDAKRRLMRNIQRGRLLSKVDTQSVVVADLLTPADLILFSRQNIVGLVLDFGGLTSHVTLIARSLNIPVVIGLHSATSSIFPGDWVTIDGVEGKVTVRPTDADRHDFEKKTARYATFIHLFDEYAQKPVVTTDGHAVKVAANIEFRDELMDLMQCGADGVGLYRTEHLFLSQGYFPSEARQYEYYKQLFREVKNEQPFTIRLFDIGGDKVLASSYREMNPFLGWRGIRILLDRPDILKNQLSAIIRAAQGRRVRILVPMIHNVQQVLDTKAVLDSIYDQLQKSGDLQNRLPFGIMIEVPSAAIMADQLAPHVDFFSIGTNDLTQYTLAIDRTNDIISGLFREMEPAVLHLINQTIAAANRHGIEVAICGEFGSNVLAVPLLVGMGLNEFSVVIRRVPEIRYLVSHLNFEECRQLKDEVLKFSHVTAIESHIHQWLAEKVPAFSDYC